MTSDRANADTLASAVLATLEKVLDKQGHHAGLYVVATPIGNLGDLSLRALAVLSRATAIACEDTRVTRKLLSAYALRVPVFSCHQHNEASTISKILSIIAEGGIVALVSDAGTPLVSDPGQRVIAACIEAGADVRAIPGPSAALAALAVAGLPVDRFLFVGFLPPRPTARRAALASLRDVVVTMVLFETGKRLRACLVDIADVLGNRPIVITRELTKKFEQVYRGTTGTIADSLGEDAIRGEITLVVGAAGTPPTSRAEDWVDVLTEALATHSLTTAVDITREKTGLPRKMIYRKALALTKPVLE